MTQCDKSVRVRVPRKFSLYVFKIERLGRGANSVRIKFAVTVVCKVAVHAALQMSPYSPANALSPYTVAVASA